MFLRDWSFEDIELVYVVGPQMHVKNYVWNAHIELACVFNVSVFELLPRIQRSCHQPHSFGPITETDQFSQDREFLFYFTFKKLYIIILLEKNNSLFP